MYAIFTSLRSSNLYTSVTSSTIHVHRNVQPMKTSTENDSRVLLPTDIVKSPTH